MTTGADDESENALYELLPTIFRQQDISQGYPLLALTKVFDHIRARLAVGVSELEQDWFIETCPLDYVPLIGGLLGLEIAKPVRPEHRALVADALAFRRRKGIAAALPRLVRDSSGWYSLYSPGAQTPWATWPLADASLPPAESEVGPLGLLRIWRLPVFAVIGATPAPAAATNYHYFNPLGMDQPLFNLPNTPLDWVAAPPVTALPAQLTVAMLAADLARYAAMWPDPSEGPPNSLLYGPARGLVIRTQSGSGSWTALRPGQIRAMSLAGYPLAAPDYPVLEGGTIDLALVRAVTTDLTITFGDATAELSVDVPATPTMSELVALLQTAVENATVVAGARVTATAVEALRVGAVGNALVIVPGMSATEPLTIGPTQAGGANPLLLAGSARLGIAAATLSLTPRLIGLLTGAPPGAVMAFTAPAGQVLTTPLPFALGSETPAAVAQAFAAALPNCFVCTAGDQVVIVPPGAVSAPPEAATAPAQALGLTPAIAVDPELGLFSWPAAWPAGALSVDYGVAAPGVIGGVGRRPPPRRASAAKLDDAGNPAWLEQQLGSWGRSKVAGAILTLKGSATRQIASQTLAVAAGQSLWIVGAGGGQPCVVTNKPGLLSLLGPPPAADPASRAKPGAITISGVTLEASIALVGGALELALLDATLYPGSAPLALAALPQTPPLPTIATLNIERCLLGPTDFSAMSGRIEIDSTVLSALPTPDRLLDVLTLPVEVSARFSRLTLIGGGMVSGKLDAADSLFDGVLACSGKVSFTNCYVRDLQYLAAGDASAGDVAASPASVTLCGTCGKARRIRLTFCLLRHLSLARGGGFCSCGSPSEGETRDCSGCTNSACAEVCPLGAPGQTWEPLQQPPLFAEPNAYPFPDFARLRQDNPPEILAGASNRDVLGAYNLAAPTTRRIQFKTALKSGLLLGAQLDLRFES